MELWKERSTLYVHFRPKECLPLTVTCTDYSTILHSIVYTVYSTHLQSGCSALARVQYVFANENTNTHKHSIINSIQYVYDTMEMYVKYTAYSILYYVYHVRRAPFRSSTTRILQTLVEDLFCCCQAEPSSRLHWYVNLF